MEVAQESVICDLCQNALSFFCSTCGKKLCEGCKIFHNESEGTKTHIVVWYQDRMNTLKAKVMDEVFLVFHDKKDPKDMKYPNNEVVDDRNAREWFSKVKEHLIQQKTKYNDYERKRRRKQDERRDGEFVGVTKNKSKPKKSSLVAASVALAALTIVLLCDNLKEIKRDSSFEMFDKLAETSTSKCVEFCKDFQNVDQTCQGWIKDQKYSDLSSEVFIVNGKQEHEEKTLWNQDQKLSSISSEIASIKSKQEYEEKTLWGQDKRLSSISSDVASVKSKQEYEEKTLWSQDYIILSLFILLMGEVVVFLLVIKCMKKQDVLGDSLVIVSFNWRQVEKHRQLTESITSIPQNKIDSINISTREDIGRIKSKVALVYVDYNDSNIILESDQELGDIRRTTVQEIKKQGGGVIVIYFHDKESQNLQDRLYSSSLTSIQRHETLEELAAEKCVLSIFKNFSQFQKQHLAEKLKQYITL